MSALDLILKMIRLEQRVNITFGDGRQGETELADLRKDRERLELLDNRLRNGFQLEIYVNKDTREFTSYDLIHPSGYDDMNHEGKTLREVADDAKDAWYLKDGLPQEATG